MRIVIDMQGAQTTGSRNRGIGRYTMSIAQAMVRNRGENEIFLALSGLFPDTIEPIRAAFDGLLPQENIRVWHAPGPVMGGHSGNDSRREVAELIREAFLASLQPDVIHISSLFEGYVDDAVTSIGRFDQRTPVSVTLYDLIPYIHHRLYLENPGVESWYLAKAEHLRRARLCLAISESSRQEGIQHLGLPEEWAVNVSTDADAYFQRVKLSDEEVSSIRVRYGLNRPFVMYAGGIDHRKNNEGLIRAFAKLPREIRAIHQLAIVCSVPPESRQALEHLAEEQGLSKESVVLTGFVPEEHLRALYNLCSLFVFPSWHEGFGLPALEAMRCGAPVIGANTTSLPEVIGWEQALFDPHSDEDMGKTMARALTDRAFHADLVRNAERQSAKFSWDDSAQQAIAAMERPHSSCQQAQSNQPNAKRPRPKLAYVSPLPPERSGIADYSAELLPELAKHYDVEVIVAQKTIGDPWIKANCPVRSTEWLVEHADHYDRVLYHFGNSTYHQHMFGLLKNVPGVVVLHDFYLSGVLAHMEVHGHAPGLWTQELYSAHGYKGLLERFQASDLSDVIWSYPCSLSVVQASLGMIVHSEHSRALARRWYGADAADAWVVIPLLRTPADGMDRVAARQALGLAVNDLLVCSFGSIGPTKLSSKLLEAWVASPLANDPHAHLVFVGENHGGDYGRELLRIIEASAAAKRIRITGWADVATFHRYLAAADIGVQLRTSTRGETSAAVLDCMNHGLATIVNAHGSMCDLDSEAVWKLPDDFATGDLAQALTRLASNPEERRVLGARARQIIRTTHAPGRCGTQYMQAIEAFYQREQTGLPSLVRQLAAYRLSEKECFGVAMSLAQSIPLAPRQRQLLVDVSELIQRDVRTGIQRVVRNVLREWLLNPPESWRVEPVYATVDQSYRYARKFTARFLNMPPETLVDESIDYAPGDVFFGLDLQPQVQVAQADFFQQIRRQGVVVKFTTWKESAQKLLKVAVPDNALSMKPKKEKV